MEKLVIKGGKPLVGEITAGGSKNSVVGILAATLMTSGECVLNNIPNIEDVCILLDIFRDIGLKPTFRKNKLIIDTEKIATTDVTTEAATKMRASYYLLGALLGRFGHASLPCPGGCDIGLRPIDQHIKGFEALGAKVLVEGGRISVSADRLIGCDIVFDCVSVGATINVMMAAALARGVTQLVNVAKEPHVVDAANFLNYMGAKIKGAGTDIMRIEGVESLKTGEYTVIPDQIEVGTYMIAAASTGGCVRIKNVIPKHMETLCAKLEEMGAGVEYGDDNILVTCQGRPQSASVKTAVYPGFPTDLQQPLSAMMCIAEGRSTITETIYENRFKHLDELQKMGAVISVKNNKAYIEGVETLYGTKVNATDLRAGASLVIAGLSARGTTEIYNIEHIDRGYEAIEKKLRRLGADIVRERAD